MKENVIKRNCPVTKGQPVSMTERGWKAVCNKTRAEAIQAKKKPGEKITTVFQQFRQDSKCLKCDQTVPAEVTFITIDQSKIIAPEPPKAYQPMRPVKVAAKAAALVKSPAPVKADPPAAPEPGPKKAVKPLEEKKQETPSPCRKPGRQASQKSASAADNDRRVFLRNGCKWMTICALTRAFNQRFAEKQSEVDVARMLIDWQVLGKAVPSASRRKGGRAR